VAYLQHHRQRNARCRSVRAEEILPLLTRLARARSEPPDRQIDQLVYELYGLTEEEIKILRAVTQQAQRKLPCRAIGQDRTRRVRRLRGGSPKSA